MSARTLSERIRRSHGFRAQSARRFFGNIGKLAYRASALEKRSLLESAPSCELKSDLLCASSDKAWLAARAETLTATPSKRVFAEAGTRNGKGLEASFGETSFATPPIVFGRFHDCIAEPRSIRLVSQDARLVSETTAIHDILDPLYRDSGHLIASGGKTSRIEKRYPAIDTDVIFAFNSFSASFGHYLLTTIPIVLCFLDEIKDGALKIVVPPELPAWMTLRLFELGLEERHLLFLPATPHRFRSAVISNILDACNTRAPNPASIRWLRGLLPQTSATGNPKRKIYVKRAASGNLSARAISNEDDILRVMRSNGFDMVEPETLSLSAQAAAFHEADVIASPHGSTLANLVFCRPGSHVLDLMPDDWVGSRGDRLRDVWALRICSLVNLDYSVLMSPSRVLQRHFTGNPNLVSEVSPAELTHCIQRYS